MDKKKAKKETIKKAMQDLSGMTSVKIIGEHVTSRDVKDAVRELNNNPRNSDMYFPFKYQR